jgi:hypothetical protein
LIVEMFSSGLHLTVHRIYQQVDHPQNIQKLNHQTVDQNGILIYIFTESITLAVLRNV